MIGKQSQKKKYPLVNWADGMPVNKGHFTQQEDHFTDRLCEYQSFHLNRNTYGLLPFKKGEPVSGDFSITELVTGTLEVRLKRCHALTSGGYLIDYDAGEDDELTASFHIPTEEEEENFLAVLSRADQRRFLLGKMAVLNRKEYGYPTYTGWCTEHWGTDENVISFEECNENSIAFLTHSAPASEAIHTLSILFPKVKLTFAWEENKVALMDDEVVLHYEVYRYGELAESKSAIAGKTHWQYNGSLKKPLYCTPQEDNDYGEIPEGISAEDFEEPDAMPF